MDISSVLSELGLSEGEIKVYLALLKLGSSQVSKLKEETSLHRTTIYDFLEKLLNKGLVNYVIKNNVKYYNATEPQKLSDLLKEKQEHLMEVMPELEKLSGFRKEEIKVELYKGKEGLKTVMLDAIRTKKDLVGMGIDEIKWKKALPVFIEQYQRMLKENKIHERIMTKMNPEYLFDQKQTHYKFIPEEYFSPTSTLIYGDKIQIVIWEPSLMALIIENKKLAEAYKKHFEAIWQQESMIFRGEENIKAIFLEMVETLSKGEEYLAFGIPPESEAIAEFVEEKLMMPMQKKGIKARVIFDERAKEQIKSCKKYKSFKYKVQSKDITSPTEVDIYGDKVAIILWTKVPQAFVIKNKEAADSFRKYFEVMWKTAKKG